jgi:glycosyltransferase involved in cell wall biosynthesis
MEKGGAERQLMLLTLASRQHNVILVLEGNERPAGVQVELLPSLRNPIAVARFTRAVIRRHAIDIVQLWLPDRMTVPAMFAARLEGCAIISGDRRKVRNEGLAALRDRIPYINHLAADIVVPNYPYMPPRLSLRRFLGIPRKVHTILNGLSLDARPPTLRRRPDRLLFVGRLVEQKRVGELIGTLPALIKAAGVTGLDIVGEGPLERDYHARIAARGLENRVTLHGRLSDWGTRFSPERYAMILPSTSEGMSNTLFEAIAWGFLPLVSRSPELEVILKDWAHKPVMFDPWHPESIVAATSRALAQTTEDIQTQIRGMQDRLADFSVERMAAAYDAIYDWLLLQMSTE